MEKILRNIINKMQGVEYRLNIESVRYTSIKDECKKNSILSVIFLLINVALAIGSNIYIECTNVLSAISFIIMICCMLYSSKLWNFALCPEKYNIKKYVNIQIVIRFIMIIILNIINYSKLYFIIIASILNLFDCLLNVIIRFKGNKIVIKNNVSVFREEITQWEIDNLDKITNSITYGGVIIYIASIAVSIEMDVATSLIAKISMLIFSLYAINKKLIIGYENKDNGNKKILIINIFLIIGFFINIVGITLGNIYFLDVYSNIKGVKELSVLIPMMFLLPLCNEYARIGNKIKKIRYEMEIQKT